LDLLWIIHGESYAKAFPFDKVFPGRLDPGMIDDTARIVNGSKKAMLVRLKPSLGMIANTFAKLRRSTMSEVIPSIPHNITGKHNGPPLCQEEN